MGQEGVGFLGREQRDLPHQVQVTLAILIAATLIIVCVDYLSTLCKPLKYVTVKIRSSSKNTVLTKTVRRLTNTNHTSISTKQ